MHGTPSGFGALNQAKLKGQRRHSKEKRGVHRQKLTSNVGFGDHLPSDAPKVRDPKIDGKEANNEPHGLQVTGRLGLRAAFLCEP